MPVSSPTLLIVWHSRTGASQALAAAAHAGAQTCSDVVSMCKPAVATTTEDMLTADAYLFLGPENLGALSGAMKELLDQSYYPLLGHVEGRPYAHIVAAGSDGRGAAQQLARIVTGWRLKAVAEPLIVPMDAQTPERIAAPKQVPPDWLDQAHELGSVLAHGISMGIF